MQAKKIKDLDVFLTEKTGADKNERQEWRDALNGALEAMRKADKEGDEESAAKFGDEANSLFKMGPGGYKRMKEAAR